MNVKMDVNVSDFVRDINEVKRESSRSTEEMLNYVMILMLRAGRNNVPLGKKNRPLETEGGGESEMTELNTDDGSGMSADPARKFFTVYHPRTNPDKVFLPRIPRKTKKNQAERDEAIRSQKSIIARFKEINFRGVARASFGWAMWAVSRKLADTKSDAAALGLSEKMMRRNPIEMTKQLQGSSPFIEIVNRIGYLLKIAPGIEQKMINSADATLTKWLDRRWQTGIDKASRRHA